jgi:hypothetical protein
MKQIQNNPKNPKENLFQPMDFKNLKKKISEPKSLETFANVSISKNKTTQ